MLLSDRDILQYIDRGQIHIDPFDLKCLGSNSYDLHLGDELRIYEDDVLDARNTPTTKAIPIPDDGYVLQPSRVYLGATEEWTETYGLVPILEGKSSLARLGLSVVSDGGFGDIGFKGAWTLELSVKQPVRIYPGMEICQISYLTTGPCELPYYDKPSHRYSNRKSALSYRPPSEEQRQENERVRADRPGPVHTLTVPVLQCEGAGDLPLPSRGSTGSAGVDLHAALGEPTTLQPGETSTLPAGIKLALPEGMEAQVRSRSGLASDGIVVANSPGTIDSDYRGEVKVLLRNQSGEPFTVERGDRIAQLVIQRVQRFEWEPRETLDETQRQEGGLGSTGVSSDVDIKSDGQAKTPGSEKS